MTVVVPLSLSLLGLYLVPFLQSTATRKGPLSVQDVTLRHTCSMVRKSMYDILNMFFFSPEDKLPVGLNAYQYETLCNYHDHILVSVLLFVSLFPRNEYS